MAEVGRVTPRQQRVYDAIRSHVSRNGYGPTIRELGDLLGIRSPNGVLCHLKPLEKKGLIARGPKGTARTIRLCEG